MDDSHHRAEVAGRTDTVRRSRIVKRNPNPRPGHSVGISIIMH